MKRVVVISISVITLLGLVLLCAQFRKDEEHIPFDIDGWNAPMSDSEGFTGTRLKMVGDLLSNYDFHGWHIVGVRALLGEPIYEHMEDQRHTFEYDLRDGLKLLIFEVDDNLMVINYYLQIDD